jgi:hypothetical protein
MQIVPPDLSDMRTFLTSPLPRNVGTLQCYIRRNKSGTNKLFPIYSLYLKEGDVFLMASKKRPKNKTSNYLISMGETTLNASMPVFGILLLLIAHVPVLSTSPFSPPSPAHRPKRPAPHGSQLPGKAAQQLHGHRVPGVRQRREPEGH